jgi:DNA-binding GntR family transcriptional regulator
VYAEIRGWIVEGLLPPDTRLRDHEIAEAMQVSRTPVREAIRRLQDENLVVAEASRWTKVAPVDVTTADRVYPIVWTLESLALRRCEPWTPEQVAELDGTNERLADALEARDPLGASAADTEFHRQVVAAAHEPELAEIVDGLKLRLRRVEITYFGGLAAGERSVEEHRRVVSALRSDDLDGAAQAIEENWRSSLARLHDRLARGDHKPL